MRRKALSAAAAMILLCGAAAAQTGAQKPVQKVTPPETRYWMGATTGGGMMAMMGFTGGGGFGIGDAMRMASGGMPEYSNSVELRLGSSLTGASKDAAHTFPAGAQVNQPIQLAGPKPETPTQGPPGEVPYERPKGRIKFYWGCGETAPKGQPVVLDFEKLANGQMPDADLGPGVDVNEVRKPSTSNSRTYVDFPNDNKKNDRLKARFGPGTTLAGSHTIASAFAPEIKFTLGRNFLAPVRYTSTAKTASGAINIAWSAVDRATGYSLGVLGGRQEGDKTAEMVIWSSSAQPATFIMHEDLAPSEVARLIKAKAVLAPSQTSCAIPAQVVAELAKAGAGGPGASPMGGGMLAFTAFGDQETFIHPPRPQDPAITWDQEWFARVSYKSIRMDAISGDGVTDMSRMMAGAGAGAGPGGAQMSDAEYCRRLAAQQAERPSTAEILGSAAGIPGGGMLGRALGGRKKEEAPKDPRCQ